MTNRHHSPEVLPNLQALVNSAWLLREAEVAWEEASVPLLARGVRLDWLMGFLKEVDKVWQEVVRQHDYHYRASLHFDGVPDPDPLPFPRDIETSVPTFLVPHIIRPITQELGTPLYALVPREHRGQPEAFISHAWNNPLIGGNAFTTLYAINSYRKLPTPITYVWVDVVCYNQHKIEAIADDMKSLIGTIERVILPMVNSIPFSRLWCLWELLCAHVTGAEVNIQEANGSVYDIGFLARGFSKEFKSVEQAATSLTSDRVAILEAMVDTFGSIEKADEYIRRLIMEQLSKDSDKPWNRQPRETNGK